MDISDETSRKRKRVTRACDECRKKKVKCDGQQPCIHCTVYSYECSYDKPSFRKKASDATRLESKLKHAEHLLETLLPGANIYSPTFDLNAALQQVAAHSSLQSDTSSPNSAISSTSGGILSRTLARVQYGSPNGALNHGSSSGYAGTDNSLFASPSSNDDPAEIKIVLPPKRVAVELFEAVWSNACVLFRFYHRPQFIRDVDLLYDVEPEDYTDREYKILPLLYSVIAVGILFAQDKSGSLGFKDATEGYKYFVAARRLLDITDARDMYAIKSIVMMVMFLQCSARLSTCYSYIGIAMRSALRAGLHRKATKNYNPVDLETRKRLFWTIRKMDIYVNAMLGLPRSIDEEEFDQEMPIELDDENITEDGYFPQKEGKLSSVGISNCHTQLMEILHRITKDIYPIRPVDGPNHVHKIAHGKIEKMEAEILAWHEALPPQLKPGANVSTEYLKANRLMSVAYCYVQLVLYRPFIHYCSPRFGIHTGDEKPKLYARKCINVARRVMYLANDLVTKNMLHGAYWYSIYTIFFSVSCLVYYVHENASDHDSYGIRLDAEMGKNALMQFKESSASAKRTYEILNVMFDQLNKSTAEIPKGDQRLASASIPHAAEYNDKVPDSKNGIINSEENGNIMSIDPNYRPIFGDQDNRPSPKVRSPQAILKNGFSSTGLGKEGFQGFSPSITGGDFDPEKADGDEGGDFNTNLYMPGMMDQLDTQIFGRFLPPYMMAPQNPPTGTTADGLEDSPSVAPSLASAPLRLGEEPVVSPETNFDSLGVDIAFERNPSPSGTNNGLFNTKSWDEFLSQHVELSGVNI